VRTIPRRESGIVKGRILPMAQDRPPARTSPTRNAARNAAGGDRNLLEALPAAVYTTDATGILTFYNRAAAELAGREPRIGEDRWCVTWRLYWPDGTPLPHDQCPMAVTLKEGRPVRGVELLVERPDGLRVPVLPYPTPLHDDAGRLIGAINVLVDIHERRNAETQQKVLLDELNHRVKNNMQMLQSLLGMSERRAQSAEARSLIRDAGRRVAAMAAAQKVLYETGSTTTFDTAEFLEAVCAAVRQAFGEDIRIAIEPGSDKVSNDVAIPLALILNELLINAVKHGLRDLDGSIAVQLTRSGDALTLIVEDDGPGFDLALAQRHSSGLALVTGLARQLSGSFSVERRPGARCVVRFLDQRYIGA
jgi:PAS domain S-box-containing protein